MRSFDMCRNIPHTYICMIMMSDICLYYRLDEIKNRRKFLLMGFLSLSAQSNTWV